MIKNDFPFVKVSSINDKPKIKKEIFKNHLKNNDTLFELINKDSKRIGGNRFFGIKLPNKFSKKIH